MASAADEQYFSRGKLIPTGSSRSRTVQTKSDKRKPSEHFFGLLHSKRLKQKKKEGRMTPTGPDEDDMEILVDPLTHKNIQTGMIILGAIHKVYGSMCRISLPGCFGELHTNSYSSSYTSLMTQWADLNDLDKRARSELPKLASRDTLFKVGQLMKFCVKSVGENDVIQVSALPEDVNEGIHSDRLREGMVIQAAIASHEDYGYSLETGIQGLGVAFISAEKFDSAMHVGQVFLAKVSKNKGGRLKFAPYDFKEVAPDTLEWNLTNIVPGMVVSSQVIQDNEDGLGLWIGKQNLMGAVEPRQFPSDEKPTLRDSVPALVLYKHPFLDILNCSLRIPPIDPSLPFKDFHGLMIGQFIPKTIVTQVTSGFVKLDIPIKAKKVSVVAIATKENVSDDETKEATELFNAGEIIPCRVVGFALLEGQVYVSLRNSVVDGRFYTEDDISVGQTFDAKVKYTNKEGIVFELCHSVFAYCDFTEASSVVNTKNVQDLYPQGKPIRVKIRYINGNFYPKRYFVTCNKHIVSSRNPMIMTYDPNLVGRVSDGIVLLVKKTGVLVGFFNKVRGWVPEDQLPFSTSAIHENYRVGQVVTARVLNVHPEANRMTLSLRIAVRSATEPGLPQDLIVEPDNREPKSITGLDGIVVKVEKNALEVQAVEYGRCLIPWEHLSDFSVLSKVMFENVKVGTTFSNLAYYGTAAGRTILTMKHSVSIILGSNDIFKLDQGAITAGPVKGSGSWGVNVSVPFDQTVKIQLKDLCDGYVPKDGRNISEGQTLVCKVTQVESEIRATCKQSEVGFSVDRELKESLVSTLRTLNQIMTENEIGSVIKVVPKYFEFNIVCDYKGQQAIACAALTTEGQIVKPEPTNAIILGYRYVNGTKQYIVTIDRDIVYKFLQARQKNKKAWCFRGPTKVMTELLVLAVTKDYAAAFTKDGRIIMLTLGNHVNDVRRGRWLSDSPSDRLPRIVSGFVYDMVYGGVGVGNFCRAEGVSTVETRVMDSFEMGPPERGRVYDDSQSDISEPFLDSASDREGVHAANSDDEPTSWEDMAERELTSDSDEDSEHQN